MTKYLLPLLFFLSVSLGFNSNEAAWQNNSSITNPIVAPTPVESNKSELITLDKTVICLPCPPGVRLTVSSICDYEPSVKVSVNKFGHESFGYEYTVSGGTIGGNGANVVWNLEGAMPGTYQIRVDIQSKSNGQKRAETKDITVMEGNCGCGLCICPTLSLDAPTTSVKTGETMTFTASVSGGSGETITYSWAISEGEIIEGQGTPVIKVATNAKMAGKVVKATVEIGGVCEECNKTESASVSIVKEKSGKK